MAVRSCVQTALKAANSVVGLAGMAVIVHALWMLRAWSRQAAGLQRHLPVPWFMYALLGLGIVMCLLACSGQVAAETANGPCLYCHVIFEFFLVILEVAIAADVFLNSNWEEDFPDDPSGKFDEFKHFLRSNFEIWEWVGLSVVAAQGQAWDKLFRTEGVLDTTTIPCGFYHALQFCFGGIGGAIICLQALSTILAMVLRALGPDPEIDYDSDDDMMPATFPILRNQAQHGPNYVEPNLPRRNDSWNVRILDKANR